jgi:signal recognition particle receptor subunit beta
MDRGIAMRIAVVGVCASGKTTIVRALRQAGYDAYVVAQEHSIIPDLWRRSRPDHVVVLEADLETIRQRRGPAWPEWLYRTQCDRLADARANATVTIDTGALTVDETVRAILAAIESRE